MNFVDVQNLAGSFSLAAVNTGFTMKHRVALPGGFGNELVEHNRNLLPGDWSIETSDYTEWTPQRNIALVTATPPCSGYSGINTSKNANARGAQSPINSCMTAAIEYAGRCTGSDGKLGPEVVMFESVQAAGQATAKGGRSMMREFRANLDRATGQDYDLHHVFMSGAGVGAAQTRRRYFFVAARIPFGVDPPDKRVPRTYRDAIWDLRGLKNTWETQPILNSREGFGREYRNQLGLADSHAWPDDITVRQALRSIRLWEKWPNGTYFNVVPRVLPKSEMPEGFKEKDWDAMAERRMWAHGPYKFRWDDSGHVITGAGGYDFAHADEPRILSVRECFRLMGFPDDWSVSVAKSFGQAYKWVGKQMPLESAQWICDWARRTIEESPGTRGEEIGEREFVYQYTHAHKIREGK